MQRPKSTLKLISTVIIGAALLSACDNGDIPTSNATVAHLSRALVTPSYTNAATDGKQLAQDIQTLCASPSAIATAQTSWEAAYLSWQALSPLTFAALTDEQSLRIQFFPDDRNLVVTQIDQLLSQPQPITQSQIDNGTAPIQGFPALEYLLFESNNASALDSGSVSRTQHCAALKAISTHLASRLNDLNTVWLTQADAFINNTDNSLDTFVEVMLRHVVAIRDDKLGTPLGVTSNGVAAPDKVEAPFSNSALEASQQSLATLNAILVGAGPSQGLGLVLEGNGHLEYFEALETAINNVLETYNGTTLSLADAVVQQPSRDKLIALFDGSFRDLRNLLQELPQRTGTSAGFNANDGD